MKEWLSKSLLIIAGVAFSFGCAGEPTLQNSVGDHVQLREDNVLEIDPEKLLEYWQQNIAESNDFVLTVRTKPILSSNDICEAIEIQLPRLSKSNSRKLGGKVFSIKYFSLPVAESNHCPRLDGSRNEDTVYTTSPVNIESQVFSIANDIHVSIQSDANDKIQHGIDGEGTERIRQFVEAAKPTKILNIDFDSSSGFYLMTVSDNYFDDFGDEFLHIRFDTNGKIMSFEISGEPYPLGFF